MEAIREWLKNKDYQAGVELYLKHGDNDFLKKLFKSKKSGFTEHKLSEELIKLLDLKPSEEEQKTNASAQAKVQSKPAQNQFVITKLQHELKQIFRSIDNNRFQLARATTDRTRKEYAFQILFLHRKKVGIYEQLDYYHEHGTLPSVKKKQPCKTDELQRLYVQIWKAKKRLEKTPEKIRNRAKTENLLAERIAQVERIKMERSIK